MDRIAQTGARNGLARTNDAVDHGPVDILLVSENFGTGHTRAAEALARGIQQSRPELRVQLIELGRALQPQINRALLTSYLSMIRRAPNLWRKVYGRHHERLFPRWLQWCLHQTLYASLSDLIETFRPKLVVSTHPFASSGVAKLKQKGFPLRLCTVITDFTAHGSWVHPEVDRYLVPIPQVREQLVQLGVEDRHIQVTGIPTDVQFWEEGNRLHARERVGLSDKPTVLILGGGLGIGTDMLVRMAAKWKEEMQIVVCTGHNRKVYQWLRSDPTLRHPHMRILGYTRRLSDWMDAADLILTKPGALTCSEAIAKGTPLLLYGSIPGHEEQNSRFLVSHGLAVQAKNEEELDAWFAQLLRKPDRFQTIRENMLRWRKHIHPSKSVEAVLEMMVSDPSSGFLIKA
jgi:processive 1,2-diacylglycerol beta-glucosyltransferase